MSLSESDVHEMIQSVMELGEALFESQWHSIKCSQSGIFSGTICTQSGIGQCRSLKTVRQSNFRRAVPVCMFRHTHYIPEFI